MAGQALAADTAAERLRLADEAREMWTASPYADCDAPAVLSETGRLEELLLTLEEVRARALLDLGRPDEALRGLAELAPKHPYRERMWSLLALAQYQCSRQADALETLRRLRERLADELGVDPSEEIRRLEEAVLRQDPSLTAPTVVRPTGPASAPLRTQPSQAGTVGRGGILEQALTLLDEAGATSPPRFLLVAGEPGIGKSRLVTDLGEAAHRAWHAGAGRSVPRGRLRPGAVALAGDRAGAHVRAPRWTRCWCRCWRARSPTRGPEPAPGCGCSTRSSS